MRRTSWLIGWVIQIILIFNIDSLGSESCDRFRVYSVSKKYKRPDESLFELRLCFRFSFRRCGLYLLAFI